jgi:hypothetical protein
MNTHYDRAAIAELLEAIDVPEGAYERAEARYRDLGEWLKREQSRCAYHAPHIYPQGAFRLGTVIRPVSKTGDYDLDLGCRLREGIAKQTHSQEDLKLLVGRELEAYRVARNIESKLEPKHRCWRIKYADEMSFHMDIVPSIPEGERRRNMIREAMIKGGMEEALADSVARYAGAITDDSLANYRIITDEWRISNAEGYALWFEARSRQAQMLLEKGVTARVDDLPTRGAKGPLQQVVQLLKWHREVMFQKWPEAKPISVIITTLAAHAYAGERNVEAALAGVLERMADYVRSERPRVPNPINAVEDFADKWQEQKYEHLQLEANFWKWLKAAQEHFGTLATTRDAALFERTAISAFGCPLPGRLQELQVEERKRKALMEKVEQMKRGARTSSTGSIGAVGIANQAHKFYGDEKVDSDKKI